MSIKMVIIMNVNRVYAATIYVNIQCQNNGKYTTRQGKYLKMSLVYHDEYNDYIDLISGEKYELGLEDTYPGDMYIYLKHGLKPVNEVYNISFKKQDMPKKKILKSISNAILLNKKEDDK